MKLIISTLVAMALLLASAANQNVLTAGGSNISSPTISSSGGRGCC